MDKETAINKVRKCLALAKSTEAHEAAAALRQAQKLMEQFGIEHPEIASADFGQAWAKSSAKTSPPRYEVRMAFFVGQAFKCEPIFDQRLNDARNDYVGGYSFIGQIPSPEVAAYTYGVLRAKLAKARSEYIGTKLKRYRKNKSAAADKFCEGWVFAVYDQIDTEMPTPEHEQALLSYRQRHFQVEDLKPRTRELTTGAEENHIRVGFLEGKKVEVHPGLGNGKDAIAGLLN